MSLLKSDGEIAFWKVLVLLTFLVSFAGNSGVKSPLGGINLKSPGGLRLGLSRNMRVKPLHANVKIPK